MILARTCRHAVDGGVRTRECLIAFLLCAVFAYAIAPFKYGDTRALVPPSSELDAALATFVVAQGVDRLLTRPASFYDTDVLYPDRTQLRSTEPFLGFALLAVPLRLVFRLQDVEVFETLRWILIAVSAAYGYLLFRALGAGPTIAAAGTALCWSHGWLLYGIERLQVVSIPLILGVVYHAVLVWRAQRPALAHQAGLFVAAALYPLCGAVNATFALLAVLLVAPWLATHAVGAWREGRFSACALPLLLAGVVDAILLAPWLLDRADLAVYGRDAFLAVKHWTPTRLPSEIANVPAYIHGMVGRGLGVAVLLVVVLRTSGRRPGAERHLLPLLAVAGAIGAVYVAGAGDGAMWWLARLFDVVCWGTLVVFWRAQVRPVDAAAEADDRPVMLAAGVGVFLCLMSFGPVFVSNAAPLANHVLRVFLEAVPPLKLAREFYRLWIFGALALSAWATLRLSRGLDAGPARVRRAAGALVIGATISSIASRELVLSAEIEAPADLVSLATESRAPRGLYVHPEMTWNSRTGVFMLPLARRLGRPVVNGYLGIEPPYFGYAAAVLRRFPDPESIWLLDAWQVDTVIALPASIPGGSVPGFTRTAERNGASVWDRVERPPLAPHPSRDASAIAGLIEADTDWASTDGDNGATRVTVKPPPGFATKAIQVHFEPHAVMRIPDRIDVLAGAANGATKVNDGASGTWLFSLAADALLHRQRPVAIIRLQETTSGSFVLECHGSTPPPVHRIVSFGRRSE